MKNNIPIFFASDERFVPYMLTAIMSMLDHISDNNQYNLFILQKGLHEKSKKALHDCIGNYSNVTIKFVDVETLTKEYNFYITEHFTIATFYRILIQDLFPDLDKVLYLDGDIIIKADIAELFNIDIGDNYLGATYDIGAIGDASNNAELRQYFQNKLHMKNYDSYFNAGILIMNLKQFRSNFTSQQLLELACKEKYPTVDQDLLNCVCYNKVHYFGMDWNLHYDYNNRLNKAKNTRKQLFEEYIRSRNNPKIIHYAGYPKPWHDPTSDFTEEFWLYARKNPFYINMINQMYEYKINSTIYNIKAGML